MEDLCHVVQSATVDVVNRGLDCKTAKRRLHLTIQWHIIWHIILALLDDNDLNFVVVSVCMVNESSLVDNDEPDPVVWDDLPRKMRVVCAFEKKMERIARSEVFSVTCSECF